MSGFRTMPDSAVELFLTPSDDLFVDDLAAPPLGGEHAAVSRAAPATRSCEPTPC